MTNFNIVALTALGLPARCARERQESPAEASLDATAEHVESQERVSEKQIEAAEFSVETDKARDASKRVAKANLDTAQAQAQAQIDIAGLKYAR